MIKHHLTLGVNKKLLKSTKDFRSFVIYIHNR